MKTIGGSVSAAYKRLHTDAEQEAYTQGMHDGMLLQLAAIQKLALAQLAGFPKKH